MEKSLEEKIWEKVQKTEDCWIWLGNVNGDGYARVYHKGRGYKPSRILYKLTHGPIPEDKLLKYLCSNRSCVNPSHLIVQHKKPKILKGPPNHEELFWQKVQKTDNCWLWTGCKGNGYGNVTVNRQPIAAHRLSYQMTYGPIPEGMWVLHNCPGGDNKLCVNPAHLYLGTYLDNARDMVTKGQLRPPTGARHGAYTKPERRARGDRHGTKTKPETRPRGEGHGRSKLSWDDVRSIRELYSGGLRQKEISERFSISDSQVYRIVTNQLWKEEKLNEKTVA